MRLALSVRYGACLLSACVFSGCAGEKEVVDTTAEPGPSYQTTARSAVSTAPSTRPSVAPTLDAGTEPDSTGTPPTGPGMTGIVNFGDSGTTLEWTGEGEPCGAAVCKDAVIQGAVQFELDGCCAADDSCGLDLSQIDFLIGLKNGGCERLDQPGSPSPDCPASDPISAVALQANLVLEPCCQTDGTCGYIADFSGLGFGCVPPERFGQSGGQTCTYAP